MADFQRILSAKAPLTLASVTRGAQPLVMADLARAVRRKGARAVFVADNEAAMRAVAEAAQFFAPELDVIEFPAWDCLPYDRASPALSVSARAAGRAAPAAGQAQRPAASRHDDQCPAPARADPVSHSRIGAADQARHGNRP